MEDLRNEGKVEGLQEGARAHALSMLEDGSVPLEKIAKFVGLALEEVKQLQVAMTV